MFPRTRLHAMVLVLTTSLEAAPLGAQQPLGAAPESFPSRQELTDRAARAEREGRTADAAHLRHRLSSGDFDEGDRIVVRIAGFGSEHGDTVVVRTGRLIPLAGMSDFPVAGVLRSELASALIAHLSRFLHAPDVRVIPLIRITVIGSVRAPGFYYVPADVPLSDIIMSAGGPSADGDLTKVEVRRDRTLLVTRAAARIALREGRSADHLHLETGDRIIVGASRRFSWQSVASAAVAVSGVAIAISRSRSVRAWTLAPCTSRPVDRMIAGRRFPCR